ncbi:hypothetical protein RHECIAT_CH0001496 [Rhizobium etli CIAT 652]|uniref:Uncharacterized protein n=1 Tax=Rhizobium etli (strain CIAT 652) TaxID=491916 RepID=B3PUS5_RHIE6|nr:hypothetical protein RHECIAT_CH0001496 [Rhizobium etli CIAT 652]
MTVGETKTAGPALALANNLSADNADNRFHAAFYGAGMTFGQEGRGTIRRHSPSAIFPAQIACSPSRSC